GLRSIRDCRVMSIFGTGEPFGSAGSSRRSCDSMTPDITTTSSRRSVPACRSGGKAGVSAPACGARSALPRRAWASWCTCYLLPGTAPRYWRIISVDRSDESESLIAKTALGRRQFLRGIAATSAVVGAGGFLTACSGSSASTSTGGQSSAAAKPKRGGDLKVGLTGGGPTDTVDPHKGITYLDSSRLQSLYSPLVQLDANAELEYMLAESITPNGNFTKWTVKLRQGVTFHDGKPLTAQDVVFTLNRILSNQLSG